MYFETELHIIYLDVTVSVYIIVISVWLGMQKNISVETLIPWVKKPCYFLNNLSKMAKE